jgi:glycosyltransferase involved in cell wall biosynthesis
MAKTPLRILFICHDSSRTGAPIGLLAFMRWLKANTDYQLGSILKTSGPLEGAFRELGPALTLGNSFFNRSRLGRRIKSHLPRRFWDESKKIRQMFSQGSYDVIYSNTMTNGAVLESLAPSKVPVITHVHELQYWIAKSGKENLQSVLKYTSAYIAVANAVRENLVRNHGVPEEKVTVIYEHIRELPPVPTAAERQEARRKLGIPAEAFVVGGCGAEHWRKGRDLIPQLLAALRKVSPSRAFHFLWIGRPGNESEEYALRYDLEKIGLEANFHGSRGEVSDPFALYPAIDVFALLSRDDPYPLACLEVAATETPVVCFADAGGMPEFVCDGCGFVAPYLDVDAMAQDIVRLADNSSFQQTFGRQARQKVARESTLDRTAPQLVAAVKQVLGDN